MPNLSKSWDVRDRRILAKRSLRLVLLCSSVALMSSTARAQVEPVANADDQDIIVTAQKRSQSVQDVPMTIDTLGTEQLQERQIQTISDLTTSVPGLRTDDIAGMSNIVIRGVGTTFTTGAGESSVAVHIDGIYIPQPKASLLGQNDLERIEVLRGPQGTLYGRNSTAGIINFITGSPSDTLTAGASLRYGNYNDIRGQAYVSGPLTDSLRGRIYVTAQQHDGWGKNLQTGEEVLDLKSYGVRAALEWDVAPWWTAELKVSADKEKFAGPLYQPFTAAALVLGLGPPFSTLKPNDVRSFEHYKSSRRLELVSLKNEFDLSQDISLVSLTGYVHFQSLYNFDGFAAAIQPPYPVPGPQDPITLRPFTESDAFSQELDLKGKTGGLDWLVGLYYFREKQKNNSTSNFNALGAAGLGLVPFTFYENLVDQSSRRTSISAFFDATYSISQRFRVFGGARILNEKLNQDLTNIQSFGFVTPGDFPVTACSAITSPQRLKKTALTGRAGVQYDVTGDSMAYAQYSTGYKAGGFSQTQCGNQYKPETVTSIEIGYKSEWFDRRLTLNLAAYHYAYKNLEIEQATIFGVPIVNAPKSHVWGLDAAIVARATNRLRFDGTATFLKSEYDEFFNQDGTFGVPVCANPSVPASCPAGSDLAGTPLNKAPGASGTIGAEYSLPTSIGDLDLRAEVYLTSKYHLREYNFPWTIQKGYEIVNLYATWKMSDDRYQIRAFAKNIFDKRYIAGINGLINGAVGVFNPPALYGVELTVKM